MASPVNGQNQGNGIDQFKATILGWIRQEIANAQRGGNGMITDAQGDVYSQGFDGTFNPATAGTTGWGLARGGDAVFNNITLRGGIVGNDALNNPVVFDGTGGAVTGFGLTTSPVTQISVSRTVPAGCTKMASFCQLNAFAINSRTAADYLQGRVTVGGFLGTTSTSGIAGANSGSGFISASKYGILTGLTPGGTVIHTADLWANGGAWAAGGSNIVDLQVLILWGR